MALTFRGGIEPEEIRPSADRPLEEMPAPEFLFVPLLYGETPLTSDGDRVLKGQKIAEAEGTVHAPVSGVVRLDTCITEAGERKAIRIENDFKEELCPTALPFHTPIHQAEPEILCRHLREKGIPAWQKIAALQGKEKRLVIDCTETEPYSAISYRLCLEKAEEIVGGVKILMRACGAEKTVFVIEDTREDAADALLKLIRQSENFAVAFVKAKYPQSEERLLVKVLTKKEIPYGKSAADLGYLILRPETAFHTYRAFVTGLPKITKAVTVSGDCVKNPANLFVPVGTEMKSVLETCGGTDRVPHKLLSGGPLSGTALFTSATVVTQHTEAVLALSEEEKESVGCIHCGRCLRACPMHLMPLEIHRLVREGKSDEALGYHIHACIECGCCSWICPSSIHLLQSIRQGKLALENQ